MQDTRPQRSSVVAQAVSNGVRPYSNGSKPVLDASQWDALAPIPSPSYARTPQGAMVPNRLRIFSGTANPVSRLACCLRFGYCNSSLRGSLLWTGARPGGRLLSGAPAGRHAHQALCRRRDLRPGPGAPELQLLLLLQQAADSLWLLQESIRGCDVFLVQPTSPPVNDSLMELLVMIDACRQGALFC